MRAFFEKNQTAFAQPARYGVETVFVSGAEARDAAAALAEKWRAGTKPDGAPDPSAPPAVLLPLSKIADYLGAGAAGVVSAMEEGGVSEPVAAPGGWRVLRVVRREPERVPSFGEVRPLVKAELIRRANERAIESLLAGLRSESSIAIANDLR
ncbi:MAG: peptidylprolyl isomerase [Deltaproteobacteria bacterium]|nr:peptidylprolyl isomerase [Deltaproteobacteria bacterium]